MIYALEVVSMALTLGMPDKIQDAQLNLNFRKKSEYISKHVSNIT